MVGTSNQSVPEMASDTKNDTVDGRWSFNHPSIMLFSYSKLWDDDTVCEYEKYEEYEAWPVFGGISPAMAPSCVFHPWPFFITRLAVQSRSNKPMRCRTWVGR